MSANFFYSLLIHAAALFILFTFPIYGGSISLNSYGYLSVSLESGQGAGASRTLQTASGAKTGKVVSKRGESSGGTPHKVSPGLAEKKVPTRNTAKKESASFEKSDKKRPSSPPSREIEEAVKNVPLSAGSVTHEVKKNARKPRMSEARGERLPVLTAKAAKKDEMADFVPDLFGVPKTASAMEETGPAKSPSTEMPAEKSSPAEKTDDLADKIAADLFRIPPSPLPATTPSAKLPPEATHAAAPEEKGGKLPEPEAASAAVDVEKEIEAAMTKIGETTYGPDQKTAKAEAKKVPQITGKGKGSNVPAEKEAAATVAQAVQPLPESEAAPSTGVDVEKEIEAAMTKMGETTYGPGEKTAKAEAKKVPQITGKEEGSNTPVEKEAAATVAQAVQPLPESEAAPSTGVDVEKEIEAAVTRIGETTYGTGQKADTETEGKSVQQLAEEERGSKTPPEKEEVATVTQAAQPLPESEAAPSTGVDVEKEIETAVTRIGETTYGADQKAAVMPARQPFPVTEPLPVTLDLEKEIESVVTRIGETTYGPDHKAAEAEVKKLPQVAGKEEGTEMATENTAAAAPASPLSTEPTSSSGKSVKDEQGGKGTGGSRDLGTAKQRTDWLEDMGKVGQILNGTQSEVKRGTAKAVAGFPMPEIFFQKDIRIKVSLKTPEMPEVSMVLRNRPLSGEVSGNEPDGPQVVLKDEKEKITVGGRVSMGKVLSVAKAPKGVYTFVMENKGDRPCEADITFILYGDGKEGRIKTYEGSRFVPGSRLTFRFLLPQAIFWDDTDSFTGSIENSDSVTKFNYATGLVWKEKKSY